MRKRAGTLAVLMALLAGCGGGTDEVAELPGEYGAIISETADCTDLQAIFDTADKAGYVEVMEAADQKMRDVGCYGYDA